MATRKYVTYKGRKYRSALLVISKKMADDTVSSLRKAGYLTVVKFSPKIFYDIYAVTKSLKGGYNGYLYFPEATMKIYDEKHMRYIIKKYNTNKR